MSGEEAPGQKRRCFPEILDLVFRLSDGAWRMLLYVANVTQVSQLQFAALSTRTIISAAKSVLQRCVPSLIGPAGMDIVLMEEGLLRKRVESESVSPAGPSTSADSTGPSSSTSAERCTNDASGGIERLHHPTASRALWNIPALNTGSAMLIRKAGSETVRDTLENRSTSSQETSSSSSSLLDGREPEVVRKRSRGLRFFGGRKAPFISFGQKKSTKAGPAGVESTNHQADSGNHQSDSGNHQSDSGSQLSFSALQTESTAKPFRKARKRLSRMFSAVRKALPNPCSCMCPPSVYRCCTWKTTRSRKISGSPAVRVLAGPQRLVYLGPQRRSRTDRLTIPNGQHADLWLLQPDGFKRHRVPRSTRDEAPNPLQHHPHSGAALHGRSSARERSFPAGRSDFLPVRLRRAQHTQRERLSGPKQAGTGPLTSWPRVNLTDAVTVEGEVTRVLSGRGRFHSL
ncbi:hypothetical protein MHYP_G00285170 [Metynnis hypsauchen]